MFLIAVWLLADLQIYMVRDCDGARILECNTGSVDAVEGDTNFTLTCDQYSGSISWQYRANPTTTNQDIGTCTEQSCQVNQYLSQYYQLQWLTDFSSKLTFYHALTTARESAGFMYSCDNDRCTVEVTVPAELGTPSVVLSRPIQGGRVTVTGTVDITRVYSSQGQYNCTWIRQQGGQSIVVTTRRLFLGPNENKTDIRGSCDFTDSLDPSSATYTYKVIVYPGATEKTQTVEVDGPENASIPENPVFYTDSTGSQSLTLTCKPGDINSTTGLIYRWTGRCADVTSDRCSFRPRPPDENVDNDVGATIQCHVTNPFNNETAHASFVLQLKYPPRIAPQIQGYTNNQIMYQGDPMNINCTVAGGEPPVTSVTLTCTGHSQGPSTGQSSSLSVTSLNAVDHGAVCTCSASWVKPEYYTLTATRTLTVYSPNTETDPQAGDSSSGGLSTGAAVGVALALVFVVVGVVVVLMWRRHWVLPCASSSANGSNNTEYNESAVSPPVSVEREEQQNDRSNEMPDNKQQATNQYEILRPLDVGMRSDYAELSHCHAGMKSDDGADNNQQATNQYEILRPLDVGVRSDYAELSHCHAGMKSDDGAGPPQGNTQPSDGRVYQNVAESSLT